MRNRSVGRPADVDVSQRLGVLRLIAVATIPFLLLAGLSIWRGVHATEARVAEEREALARAAAQTSDAIVDGGLATLESLVASPVFAEPYANPDLGVFLTGVRQANPYWDSLALLDKDGWVIEGAGIQPRSFNVADRNYFQHVMATGGRAVSRPLLGRVNDILVVVLAVSVEFANGERGVLAAGLSLAALEDELRVLHDEASIHLELVDPDGRVFLHPDSQVARALVPLGGRPDVDAVLAGERGSRRVTDSNGTEMLIAYAPVATPGWGVLVVQPASDALGLVRRQLAEQLGLLGLAAAVAGLVGWRIGGDLERAYHRERAARAHSEQQRRFLEALIASAPVAIAVLKGPEHRYVTVNARYQALLPSTHIVGRTLAEVSPELESQGAIELLDRVYRTGRQATAVDQPYLLDDATGQIENNRYFTLVLSRYEDAEGKPEGVLVIVLETTETVLSRQRAEREKDEFLATASHELKTPIASLMLSAQMIRRVTSRGSNDPTRLDRLVGSVESQAARAAELISDLLDVARLQGGAPRLRLAPVDLVQLTRTIVERERDTLPDGDPHEIVVDLTTGPLIVDGDEGRLDQVLTNLLSNALKYSPRGGRVQVRLVAREDCAELSVADQGIGIPDVDLGVLFTPFGRTEAATSSGISGTGLGLYITRRIVEAHAGTIGVSDTPGGGATFTVKLPLASTAPGSA